MARSGIGQDSYFRVQKETTYGTELTNSMTLWPVNKGVKLISKIDEIPNEPVVSSRLKVFPNKGNEVCTFTIPMDLHPTLLGQVFQFFLGTSTNGTVTDGTYLHTWLTPITGSTVGSPFTAQIAKGSDLATTFAGMQIHEMKIMGEVGGKISLELTGTAETQAATGVTRITSFSYPTATPLNSSMIALTLDPSDAASFSQLINSFELTIKLGLDDSRFKAGSTQQLRPQINTYQSLTFSCNIDADKQFVDAARAFTTYNVALTVTSTEFAAGTTPYLFAVEIPKAKLKIDTDIPLENDTLSMDLEFACDYGGTTTGSSSTLVMAEFRVKDATATYA
jgi:hypothetical protein